MDRYLTRSKPVGFIFDGRALPERENFSEHLLINRCSTFRGRCLSPQFVSPDLDFQEGRIKSFCRVNRDPDMDFFQRSYQLSQSKKPARKNLGFIQNAKL